MKCLLREAISQIRRSMVTTYSLDEIKTCLSSLVSDVSQLSSPADPPTSILDSPSFSSIAKQTVESTLTPISTKLDQLAQAPGTKPRSSGLNNSCEVRINGIPEHSADSGERVDHESSKVMEVLHHIGEGEPSSIENIYSPGKANPDNRRPRTLIKFKTVDCHEGT